MKVILANNLNTADGRYKKTADRNFPTEMPDSMRKHLPSTAIIVDDDAEAAPLPVPVSREMTFGEIAKANAGVNSLEHLTGKKK